MASSTGILNKYIGDYGTLRPFLRYISLGCYNKQYFQKHLGINARTYEDNLARWSLGTTSYLLTRQFHGLFVHNIFQILGIHIGTNTLIGMKQSGINMLNLLIYQKNMCGFGGG